MKTLIMEADPTERPLGRPVPELRQTQMPTGPVCRIAARRVAPRYATAKTVRFCARYPCPGHLAQGCATPDISS